MVWWLISVPYEDSQKKTFKQIEKSLQEQRICDAVYEFRVPKLKTTTLDTLIQLGDDLAKHDQTVESIMGKVLRTLSEVSDTPEEDFIPTVVLPNEQTLSAEVFTTFFVWDENQYLLSRNLTDIVSTIIKKCARYDEELRTKTTEYQTLKNNISTLERKTSGPLATRSLDGIIRPEHVTVKESEYLQTLFIVVPKKDQLYFEQNYEDLTTDDASNVQESDVFNHTVGMCVVPGSLDVVTEEQDSILYSVVLLKKLAQDFKKACSLPSRRWVVRDFQFDQSRYQLSQLEEEELKEKSEGLKRDLNDWTRVAFSEVYSAWLHLKAIRVFVESVLRYGLPPQFCSILLNVSKNESKVHKFFRDQYKHLLSDQPTEVSDSSASTFGILHGLEFHPYVLLTLNVNNYPLLKMGK
ncbi:V-type H+-transporting ATPase subunit C [Acrasis kona]|uniref:V-type proton ATPase subunit C n=1 Tax=Acrasis kona TaxID=1008807 RepID=A0AAW2YNB7_9EUKA